MGENRANIYGLDEKTLAKWNRSGRLHALRYPVEVSGIFLPWRPLKKVLGNPSKFKSIINQNGVALDNLETNDIPFTNMDSFFDWIGLSKYPESEGEGVFLFLVRTT